MSKKSCSEVILELLKDRREAQQEEKLDAVTCTAAITACRDGHSWQHALGSVARSIES